MKLGIFPLSIFLLPAGVTRLRIFEPRYKRLVKKATQEQGFVLSLYQANQPYQTSQYGVWVEIIDFSLLDDGLLSIDIKAKHLVELSQFEIEEDELRVATVEVLPHWSTNQASAISSEPEQRLSHALEQIFTQIPQLKAMYSTTYFNDIYWVCARFLESLPLSLEKKQQFYSQQSFEQCLSFLHTVINGETVAP